MDRKQTPTDQQTALRALANKLTLRARDYAAEAKRKPAGDTQADYLRGLAEGYYKSALELADVIKQYAGAPTSVPAPEPAAAAPTASAPSAAPKQAPPSNGPTYDMNVDLSDVIRMLEYVSANPRDVIPNKDGSFTAVFSRWQPMTEAERLAKIKTIDLRVVIVATGKTKDTNDPFVQFAFERS